jgi:hypothetical protein
MAKSPSRRNNPNPKTDSAARPPRGPGRFKEREVARALRAAERAGNVDRLEIASDGRINLFLKGPAAQTGNDLDEWMAKKNARQA